MHKYLPIFAILLLSVKTVFAQGEVVWNQIIGGNSTYANEDFGYTVIGNNNGDVFMAGQFGGTLSIGNYNFTAISDEDGLIAKYDSSGNVLWAKQIKGGTTDVTCLASDISGNVYLTGKFWSLISFDSVSIGSNGGWDAFVIKLNGNGSLLYIKKIGSTGGDFGYTLEMDDPGNCFIAGAFEQTIILGNDTLLPGGWGMSGFIAKMDVTGNFLWAKRTHTSSVNKSVQLLAVDNLGNCIITEHFMNASYVDTINFNSQAGNVNDIYIASFDPDGSINWIKFIQSNTGKFVYGLDTDNDNNIYILGSLENQQLLMGAYTLTKGTFIAKFDLGGNDVWAKPINLNNAVYYFGYLKMPASLFVRDESCYIAAQFNSTAIIGYDTINNIGGDDVYFVKTDKYGAPVWTKHIGGSSNEAIYDLYADNEGHVYATGRFENDLIVENDTSYSLGSDDAFFMKINSPSNIVSGIVFNDLNGNGIKDSTEAGMNDQIVGLSPGQKYYITDNNGYYIFFAGTGSYAIQTDPPLYWVQTTPLPSGYQFNFTGAVSDTSGLNFGLQSIPGILDLKVSLTEYSPPRPGFNYKINLSIRNIGTDTVYNVSTALIVDTNLAYISSTIAYSSINFDSIFWDFDTLIPGESKNIVVVFSVSNNLSLVGKNLLNTVNLYPIINDTTPGNNIDSLTSTVVNSFDPNYKEVKPRGLSPQGYIPSNTNEFTYTVHFQNTGTDTAIHIYISDTLDHVFDINSLQMISSSHSCSLQIINGNILYWTFGNIMLPDSNTNETESHGFIKYKLLVKDPLQIPDTILNSASIIFDFNLPVYTNTVMNTTTSLLLSIPVNTVEICANDTASLTCEVISDNPFSLLWSSNSLFSDTLSLIQEVLVTDTGTYYAMATDSLGNFYVDSITVVKPLMFFTDSSLVVCEGDSVQIYGNYRTVAGIYYDSLLSVNGCDSVHSTVLILNPLPDKPIIIQNGNTLEVTSSFSYQWYFFDILLAGANAQFYTPVKSGFYSVMITDANGCSIISYPYDFTLTGTLEFEKTYSLSIFPNPNSGSFCIILKTQSAKELVINVYNKLGQTVFAELIENFGGMYEKQIDLNHTGIYNLHIQIDKRVLTEQIIAE